MFFNFGLIDTDGLLDSLNVLYRFGLAKEDDLKDFQLRIVSYGY